jgi:hypothetical protein
MALSLKQVKDICMLGSGSSQCRYLAEDESLIGKFYCLKMVRQQKPEIDIEVDEFIKKHKDRGVDPYSMGMPLGNNCGGYRLLKLKMQGYDLDGTP